MAESNTLSGNGIKWTAVTVLLVGLAATYYGFRTHTRELLVLGEEVPSVLAIKSAIPAGEMMNVSRTKIRFQTDTYDNLDQLANQDFINRTGVYDIVLHYNTALASFIPNRYVYTLSELKQLAPAMAEAFEEIEGDLFPSAWREVGWYTSETEESNNEAVAIPFTANTMLLCYNKDLFNDPRHQSAFEEQYKAKLTIPTDWAQFTRVAEYFTSPAGSLNYPTYGVCLQGAPSFIYWEWANIAFTAGNGTMEKPYGWAGNAKTPLRLTDLGTVTATKLYLDLMPFDASKDQFFKMDANAQVDRMRIGDVAMCLMWSDVAYGLIKDPVAKARFGFTPIPGGKSMLAGGSFYINRSTSHLDAAVEYVQHVMSREVQARLVLKGLCSARQSAYSSPRVQEELPYAEALVQSVQRGVYMLEAGPDSEAISLAISDALQELFLKKISMSKKQMDLGVDDVREVLEKAQRTIEVKRKLIYEALQKRHR